FIYVADCKLATTENLNEITRLGGRFVTVLPASRKEDTQFRQRLRERSESITWREVHRTEDEDGELLDLFSVHDEDHASKEGYRLLWFHSRGKADADALARGRRLQQAIGELVNLRERLVKPRTRFRQRDKVEAEVEKILDKRSAREFLEIRIEERQDETYRQTDPGRPTEKTRYKKQVAPRFDLIWKINGEQLDQAAKGDGVFPLITNVRDMSAAEILQAYKRQPIIEKRFSQLKTDFCVAPVYLKSVTRIV